MKKGGKNHVKTGEAKKEVVDSPSDLTPSRMDGLEVALLQVTAQLKTITDKLDSTTQKIPLLQKPEDLIKKAKEREDVIGTIKTVDLRNPDDAETGNFNPKDIIRLDENSPKYAAYQLDERGEAVKQKFQYECQACLHIEPYIRGASKRICPECKGTMLKTGLPEWEAGTPALGVVLEYMYTTKQKKRKYKVHFEKFSEGLRSEGLTEDEMVLCR